MKLNIYAVLKLTALLFVLLACKKDEEMVPFKPSSLYYNDAVNIAEDDPTLSAIIKVYLSKKSDSTVVVKYSTEDSTAISGTDYTGATNAELVFNPGETSKFISIKIKANSTEKKDLYFFVNMLSATNSVFEAGRVKVKILNVDYENLVWSDEFTDANLNTAFWNYELGNNNGWGNNEKEVYTNSINNVFLEGGYLNIKAIKEVDNSYTSGRLTTKGKKEFTYGKVEIMAKLPEGQGIWPALWMLGANISSLSWPKCGEIDIMELLGHQTNKTYGTIHWDENGHQMKGSNYTLPTGSFSSDFHLFGFKWTPSRFIWYVDDFKYYEIQRTAASNFPFDLPEFFIFNVAVGGNWPGNPDETTVFPQSMVVDYIRVYQ
ncbi:MAG: family 16 glycosylhydrolase [Bacteroidales bacterium]